MKTVSHYSKGTKTIVPKAMPKKTKRQKDQKKKSLGNSSILKNTGN